MKSVSFLVGILLSSFCFAEQFALVASTADFCKVYETGRVQCWGQNQTKGSSPYQTYKFDLQIDSSKTFDLDLEKVQMSSYQVCAISKNSNYFQCIDLANVNSGITVHFKSWNYFDAEDSSIEFSRLTSSPDSICVWVEIESKNQGYYCNLGYTANEKRLVYNYDTRAKIAASINEVDFLFTRKPVRGLFKDDTTISHHMAFYDRAPCVLKDSDLHCFIFQKDEAHTFEKVASLSSIIQDHDIKKIILPKIHSNDSIQIDPLDDSNKNEIYDEIVSKLCFITTVKLLLCSDGKSFSNVDSAFYIDSSLCYMTGPDLKCLSNIDKLFDFDFNLALNSGTKFFQEPSASTVCFQTNLLKEKCFIASSPKRKPVIVTDEKGALPFEVMMLKTTLPLTPYEIDFDTNFEDTEANPFLESRIKLERSLPDQFKPAFLMELSNACPGNYCTISKLKDVKVQNEWLPALKRANVLNLDSQEDLNELWVRNSFQSIGKISGSCKVECLQRLLLKGRLTIESLKWSGVKTKTVTAALSELKQLKVLDLIDSEIDYVQKSVFDKHANLIRLNFTDTKIKNIETMAFEGLTNLKFLRFSNTGLSGLTRAELGITKSAIATSDNKPIL